MGSDGPTLDSLLSDKGGFDPAYDRLVLDARFLLRRYAGETGGKIVLRQIDAEEVVDEAILRLIDEGVQEGRTAYETLRNHIHNRIKTLACRSKESKTVRMAGEIGLIETMEKSLAGQTPDCRAIVEIQDDIDYCSKVINRLLSEIDAGEDKELYDIADCIANEIYDKNDIRELTGFTVAQFEAAWKRFCRRFIQLESLMRKESL